MTTKNIQDVVAERVEEFDDFLEKYTGKHENTFELAKTLFAGTVRVRKDIIVNEFRITLTLLVAYYQTNYEQKHIASAVAVARREERDKVLKEVENIVDSVPLESEDQDELYEKLQVLTTPTSDVTKEQPSE